MMADKSKKAKGQVGRGSFPLTAIDQAVFVSSLIKAPKPSKRLQDAAARYKARLKP